MASSRFQMTFNGFRVQSESWDTLTNSDGQHDEVYFRSVNKKCKSDGTIIEGGSASTFVSPVMGDTNNQVGRIRAGSAEQPWWLGGGRTGGLISGDSFPAPEPWRKPLPEQMGRIYPPCLIWEGSIADDEVVYLTPTIWEYDGGAGVLNGWLDWQVKTDAQFGERAKKVFGPASGAYAWIFDAVSIGIQTVGTLAGQFAPAGQPGDRPVGVTRDPNDNNNGVFNPIVIELTRASAEALVTSSPSGLGQGILTVEYMDDPALRGHYILYLQLHKLADPPPANANQLKVGQRLGFTESIKSSNGRFTLLMQNDGNLVLYDGQPDVNNALWHTNTYRLSPARRPTYVEMQTDGHLILYNDRRVAAWGSGIYGPQYINPYLEMQNDGNLVIYHNGRIPIWASNTARP